MISLDELLAEIERGEWDEELYALKDAVFYRIDAIESEDEKET